MSACQTSAKSAEKASEQQKQEPIPEILSTFLEIWIYTLNEIYVYKPEILPYFKLEFISLNKKKTHTQKKKNTHTKKSKNTKNIYKKKNKNFLPEPVARLSWESLEYADLTLCRGVRHLQGCPGYGP